MRSIGACRSSLQEEKEQPSRRETEANPHPSRRGRLSTLLHGSLRGRPISSGLLEKREGCIKDNKTTGKRKWFADKKRVTSRMKRKGRGRKGKLKF